jgi:hypothetical protein
VVPGRDRRRCLANSAPPESAPQLVPMSPRLLCAAAAAVALSTACAADATPEAAARRAAAEQSTLHGKIAYSTRGGDIWVMNANGSRRRRITRSGRGIDFDPSLSPNGRRIVFRTSRGRYRPDIHGIGLEGIFVVNVRTRRERQIQPRTGGLFPAWSPDGPVDDLQLITLNQPSGTRHFEKGRLDIYHVEPSIIGRATYQPGWDWSIHVAPIAGTPLAKWSTLQSRAIGVFHGRWQHSGHNTDALASGRG